MISDRQRIDHALEIATKLGGVDGVRHKHWVIDQMVRALTGCPTVKKTALDYRGLPYEFDALGESEEYKKLVAGACLGEEGPNTYEWNVGTPP